MSAHVLLYILNSLRKSDKMRDKARILSFSSTRLIHAIKHQHSCKILYKSIIIIKKVMTVMRIALT